MFQGISSFCQKFGHFSKIPVFARCFAFRRPEATNQIEVFQNVFTRSIIENEDLSVQNDRKVKKVALASHICNRLNRELNEFFREHDDFFSKNKENATVQTDTTPERPSFFAASPFKMDESYYVATNRILPSHCCQAIAETIGGVPYELVLHGQSKLDLQKDEPVILRQNYGVLRQALQQLVGVGQTDYVAVNDSPMSIWLRSQRSTLDDLEWSRGQTLDLSLNSNSLRNAFLLRIDTTFSISSKLNLFDFQQKHPRIVRLSTPLPVKDIENGHAYFLKEFTQEDPEKVILTMNNNCKILLLDYYRKNRPEILKKYNLRTVVTVSSYPGGPVLHHFAELLQPMPRFNAFAFDKLGALSKQFLVQANDRFAHAEALATRLGRYYRLDNPSPLKQIGVQLPQIALFSKQNNEEIRLTNSGAVFERGAFDLAGEKVLGLLDITDSKIPQNCKWPAPLIDVLSSYIEAGHLVLSDGVAGSLKEQLQYWQNQNVKTLLVISQPPSKSFINRSTLRTIALDFGIVLEFMPSEQAGLTKGGEEGSQWRSLALKLLLKAGWQLHYLGGMKTDADVVIAFNAGYSYAMAWNGVSLGSGYSPMVDEPSDQFLINEMMRAIDVYQTNFSNEHFQKVLILFTGRYDHDRTKKIDSLLHMAQSHHFDLEVATVIKFGIPRMTVRNEGDTRYSDAPIGTMIQVNPTIVDVVASSASNDGGSARPFRVIVHQSTATPSDVVSQIFRFTRFNPGNVDMLQKLPLPIHYVEKVAKFGESVVNKDGQNFVRFLNSCPPEKLYFL